jgi:hypothetical protein
VNRTLAAEPVELGIGIADVADGCVDEDIDVPDVGVREGPPSSA